MLAVSPLRTTKDERQTEMESFANGGDDFPDFSCGNLLDSIDFDDLFVGINDEDVLPDLEMDPEILAEFSLSGGEESEITTTSVSNEKVEESSAKEEVDKANYSGSDAASRSTLTQAEDVVMSKRDESAAPNPSPKETDKARKSSSQSKNNPQGKKRVKVDWTPELHRRFVQAVEQIGVDKAVPSRILELMGIDCLTRHNIASHLQKYRSHRKHLLAREAEAANWNQRRQIYGVAAAATAGGGKMEMSPWIAPTMGFPPMAPMPHFRPLHVWGHPSVNQSLMPIWPKHLGPSPPPPPPPPATWVPAALPHPPTPPPNPPLWHSHHAHVPSSLTPGTPCFQPHLAPTKFPAPPVPGVPPPALYKLDPGIVVSTAPAGQVAPQPPIDIHPSKESIDAAIGDVLSKPWQPLRLGLKPPSVDGVLVELQRQGISRIPPMESV